MVYVRGSAAKETVSACPSLSIHSVTRIIAENQQLSRPKLVLMVMLWIHTYKRLLSLCISPYAWGAWVWIARAIGTHPLFSSLAIRGSPHLLSHPAQTKRCSKSLAVEPGLDSSPLSPGSSVPCLKRGRGQMIKRTLRRCAWVSFKTADQHLTKMRTFWIQAVKKITASQM